MNRKLWSNEEKVSIVLKVLRGDESAASICTRHGVSATQVYRWLDRFLEGGRNALEDKPYIESFSGSYKTEELYRKEYNSLAEARIGWESYRAWYRNDRLHQALWYKSPRDYAKIMCNSKLLVA